MEQVETRELVAFVAVAEELHFGRAAERLGMAQPPLSRTISRLERRMGVRLFERTSRRVELTAAGEVFLAEVRRILDALDAAVARARNSASPDRLVVATRPGTGPGLLADVVRAYQGEVELVFTQDQAAALRTGAADVALMCGTNDAAGFERVDLTEEKAVVLLPPEHPLARRPFVLLAEISEEDAYREQCPDDTLDQILDLVSLGRLVLVVGESVRTRIGTVVVAVPVLDVAPTRLVLAWPSATAHPARTAFVAAAKSLLHPGNGLRQAAVGSDLDTRDVTAVR
ncbi:LysR family transcriptional regulator [Lentzea sp. JNUCC 0626]|uniref:LysR family transcriptional regulator n=1 Tax=Lentzea sp. JNUCC 0626 TaxID=3367513 RepID=UPI00374844DF